MSQHTYTLKFTIGDAYADSGRADMSPKPNLDQVMNEAGDTKEDLIRKEVEEKIEKAIPTIQGNVQVILDSLKKR